MSDNVKRIRAAVLGASGYTGGELLRLLVLHPQVDIVTVTAERHAGQPIGNVFPHLIQNNLPDLVQIGDVEWDGVNLDVVFCALPYGVTHKIAEKLLAGDNISTTPRIIDLSPDFRLADASIYTEWYGTEHGAVALQNEAVYGLTEFARDDLSSAKIIACPGCYPTASLLGLIPLLDTAKISLDDIIIDAKSGVTGAGRALKESNLFAEVAEGIQTYAIAHHRHMPEIEQELSRVTATPIQVNFTPHLIPMNRGLQATIYVRRSVGMTVADLREELVNRYRDQPFVRVLAAGNVPATRHVRGSNYCLIGVFADRLPDRAIIISVLDNLVKGGAGQAVQNMNVAFGFPEMTGLEIAPLFP